MFNTINNKQIVTLLVVVISFCSCSHKAHIPIKKNEVGREITDIDELINRLNWDSFGISTNYASVFVLRADAKKIMTSKDKKKIYKLIDKIELSNKTVVIHGILTNLIEPQKALLHTNYHYDGDTIDYAVYSLNGLSWKYIFRKKTNHRTIGKRD